VKVTREKTEDSQAFLTIEMEPDEMEESLEKSYRRLVKKTRVPGFREGKAPRVILERHIGKEGLLEDTINDIFPQAYEKAVQEQGIDAIARPQVEVAQTDPVVFKVVVPLKPAIELGDYRKIKVKSEPAKVDKKDTDRVIDYLRHQHATWEPVERAVAYNDLVIFDIESSVGEEPFITQKGAQYQVLEEHAFPAPGFAAQLVGMKKDGKKDFKLGFPPDFSRKELADKEATFKVAISEIKEEVLPELNDEFARQVNPDFDTADKLHDGIAADLKLRAEEKARVDFEDKLLDALVDCSKIEFPPVLVESEVNRMLNRRFPGGKQELEPYLKSARKTVEELIEELRPSAAKTVARSLALGKFVETEAIEVSAAEIDEEIKRMVAGATKDKEGLAKMLTEPPGRESVEQWLLSGKALQKLGEMASVSFKAKTVRKKGASKKVPKPAAKKGG